jgi:hypothetical protein
MIRLLLALVMLESCSSPRMPEVTKINGVNFVAPSRKVEEECLLSVKQIQAQWVALTPYAFAKKGKPEIIHNVAQQWWGEKPEGIRACIRYARTHGLKVMIKPHVWVEGEGWAGDFKLNSEAAWKQWEQSYTQYIMEYARLAQDTSTEMLCIGTEYRQAVRLRPKFWLKLIGQVRAVYQGQLTYAANWDEYQSIDFWDQLDFIGIDAYFPISESTTPTVAELQEAWQQEVNQIESFARKHGKPVLFTEYGYRSVDKTAGKQWELPDSWESKAPVNLQAQTHAYEALFLTFWHQPWFAGGFLWKWYDHHQEAGGVDNNDYTPQRKPAEKVISQYYRKFRPAEAGVEKIPSNQ